MARKTSPANAKKAQATRQRLAQVMKATGAKSREAASVRLSELAGTLWWDGNDESAGVARVISAVETLEDLAPRDAFERLLVSQMIAVHHATMECFSRAMIKGQSLELRDSNLKHAEKLTARFATQLETLNKHRGKGQQKVTVEHVNVAAGAQAIVGNVDHRPAAITTSRRRKIAAPQLEHQVTVAPPTVNAPEASPIRIRKRSKPEHG